ncbi:MAG: flagellar M-ring protein FliF [Halobacteriovoraceae bacterium]|nr:flagellar M-ring protein FliF [Halobacteriovoraceae bacterium]
MQDVIDKIIKNFTEFFGALTLSKKISLISLTVLIVGGMTGFILWASKTDYRVLYTDLNREDAKQLSLLLEQKSIPYQTAEDGKTIKIPEGMVNRFRMEVATMGVNFSGTVGYEVFDKQSFGTTSFVQKVNRQRALEGELVKTIMYIKGVKRARVHLSIPESSPFVSELKPPSASVILELSDGVTLTKPEVKGISQLVSSSIEGMRMENVVILDNRGKKLSENIGDEMTAYTANRVALEQKMGRKFEEKVEDILTKVVGEGKVIAKVTVNLNFKEEIGTETKYDQENAAVISEVVNSQKLNGRRPAPQGVPGARSNLPGERPQPGVPETTNNVDKELKTRNFNVPTKVTKFKNPTAGVENLSVAVMIDGKRVPQVGENGQAVLDKNGDQIMVYQEWSQADLDNFSAIVSSAIGLNTNRGDNIVIKNMEFVQEDLAAVDKMLREQQVRELISNVVKYLAIGLVVSLFFFFVVRPFIQWVTDNTVESVEDFLPKTLEELEKVQVNQKLPGLEEALPQIEEKLNPEKIEGNLLREKIVSLIQDNPSKAAQIVHEMIHSDNNNKEIA